jgi:hypothetical protein
MPTRIMVVSLLVLLASLPSGRLMAQSPAGPASAPALEIPEASLQRLGPGDNAIIRNYINYHVNRLIATDNEKAVADSRNALEAGYLKYDTVAYRFTYAREAAIVASSAARTLAAAKDASKPYKEVNLGVWLASMPQGSLQSAADDFVASPDEVLRLAGWRVYGSIRGAVLAGGTAGIDRMFKVAAERMQKEQSAVVIGALLGALDFPVTAPSGVTRETLADAQKRSVAIMAGGWARLCGMVAAGNEEMVHAMRGAAPTLQMLGQLPGAEPADKTRVLQMLYDLMYAAGLCYDAHSQVEGPVAAACSLLLTQTEMALAGVAGTRKTPVMDALVAKLTPEQRGPQVRLAVLDWQEALKAQGVRPPGATQPATSTAPATAPAAAPK